MVESRWAMTKQVCRPFTSSSLERLLNKQFAFSVKRARRLVQNQDGRILEHGTRDGNALALAARNLDAAFADERSRTPREIATMKSVRIGGRCRRFDFGLGRFLVSVGDILGD